MNECGKSSSLFGRGVMIKRIVYVLKTKWMKSSLTLREGAKSYVGTTAQRLEFGLSDDHQIEIPNKTFETTLRYPGNQPNTL